LPTNYFYHNQRVIREVNQIAEKAVCIWVYFWQYGTVSWVPK